MQRDGIVAGMNTEILETYAKRLNREMRMAVMEAT
jgi:hypothetical protein